MESYIPYFITYLSLGGIFLLLQVIQIFVFRHGIKKKLDEQVTLERALFVLNDILDEHRDKTLSKKLNSLRKKYETNPDKKENSIHLLVKDADALVKNSIKEVSSLVSDDVKKTLLKYYSQDGLIRYIENKLVLSSK